jgi:hypothetical protein
MRVTLSEKELAACGLNLAPFLFDGHFVHPTGLHVSFVCAVLAGVNQTDAKPACIAKLLRKYSVACGSNGQISRMYRQWITPKQEISRIGFGEWFLLCDSIGVRLPFAFLESVVRPQSPFRSPLHGCRSEFTKAPPTTAEVRRLIALIDFDSVCFKGESHGSAVARILHLHQSPSGACRSFDRWKSPTINESHIPYSAWACLMFLAGFGRIWCRDHEY